MIACKRIWKRDGSVNLMDIVAAAKNVVHNRHLSWIRRRAEAEAEARDRMLNGHKFETDLSVISLWD